ncbi:MAG: enolase C-terminal domain-like protein [Acidimicrobiales bacterium]
MRIEGVEALVVPIALRDPVQSAGITHADKTTLFLRLVTDEAVGWGECAAYPGARAPDPTIGALEPAVVDRLVGRMCAAVSGGPLEASSVVAACGPRTAGERTLAAALEMAALDIELRREHRSLAAFVGATRSEVKSGTVVGIPVNRDIGALMDAVDSAVGHGFGRVRLKIEPGWDHQPLHAVRERWPDLMLQADANGSFVPGDESELQGLDAYDLACLEQPFAADALDAHRELATSMATPIALDESLWSLERVESAVVSGACAVACLKPGRLGGVMAAVAAARACARSGVDCFVGGFFESGLGRAVNAAVAGRDEFGLPGDLGDPDRYLEANPIAYLPCQGGMVTLSGGPGLGVEVREERLRLPESRSRWISAPS